MTMRADRRTLLRNAALAALLPWAAQLPASAQAAARRAFVPPTGPMRYSRRLVRNLAGGASFAVERSFALQFSPAADGWTLAGDQISVAVDAPAPLAAFARLERERVEQGLFPLRLDRAGQIAGGPDRAQTLDLDEAVRTAREMIERSARSAADKTEMVRFVGALHQSAAQLTTLLPTDLFVPVEIPRRRHSDVPLPDGALGKVVASFDARTDPATGMMQTAERRVITTIAGDQRETVESWTFTPL